MQTDKSAIILEAQWIEKEIPKMQQELAALRSTEQELLTTPLETVSRAYTDTYRAQRQKAYIFYHRRRSVTPTRYGYRERMLDVGWFTILIRVVILALIVWAGYTVYRQAQLDQLQTGVIWGSAILVVAIGFAFVPALADFLWERRARKVAEAAASQARQSDAFLQEKQERQARLQQCRARRTELEQRLAVAGKRLDALRKELIGTNHDGVDQGS
jgi:hypothetical protein